MKIPMNDQHDPRSGKTRPHVPLIDLQAQYRLLRPRIEERIKCVLEAGQFILGPDVSELEQALASFTGAAHVVSVANGTDALWIGLAAEAVGPGDAVFIPSFTFVGTAEAVIHTGATPVFVDVDAETFTMDPMHLADQIAAVLRQGNLRPRAVIPVDLFGLPADYRTIGRIAEGNGLFVLADAAQSFGASHHGRRVGALAAATATSFYPSKPLGGYGDSGALFTGDERRAETYRLLRHHGGAHPACVGVNSRLDTLQAAVLLTKLEVFDEELAARERIAGWYDASLPAVIRRPARPAGLASAWAHYSVIVPNRESLMCALRDEGIESRIYYSQPVHQLPAYLTYGEGTGSLPVSEQLSRQILALPFHPYLDRTTVDHVCQTLVRAVSEIT